MEQTLRKYWLYSLICHLSIFLSFLLGGLIFPSNRILLLPSVQVDMVALPNQVKDLNEIVDTALPVKEQPTPEPDTAKEESKPAEDEPTPLAKIEKAKPEKKQNIKNEAKNALEKLKAEIEKERNSKNKNTAEKKTKDFKKFEEAYRNALSGNQTSKGSSSSGASGEVQNAYYGHIGGKLRANWGLPAWLQSKGLKARVIIYIDGSGNIANYKFLASSGNEVFDDYVKATLQRSTPFAPPPSELSRVLRNTGIEVSFPYEN